MDQEPPIPTFGKSIPSFLTAISQPSRPAMPSVPRYRSFTLGDKEFKQVPSGLRMPGLSSAQSLSSIIQPTGHLVEPVQKPVFRNLDFGSQMSLDAFHGLRIEPAVKPRVLPPFYEKNTSFSTQKSPEEVFRILKDALAGHNVEAKPKKGKYKGCTEVLGKCISFQVHLFEKPEGGHLIEFQRRRGDCCAFWHFFRNTLETLSKDLADAAAMLKRMPAPPMKKRVGGMSVSEKTLKNLHSMASSEGGDQLCALEALNNLVEGETKSVKSVEYASIKETAERASQSKDPLVAFSASCILRKLDVPKLTNDTKDLIDLIAKQTVQSMTKDQVVELAKISGKHPEIGSREQAEFSELLG